MQTRRTGWIAVAIVCCLATAASAVEVAGRVVDRRGKPARDVTVATSWTNFNGTLRARGGLTVDDDGRFSGDVRFRNGGAALVAYSADGSRAGVTIVEESASGDVTITVDRAVRVRGKVRSKELGTAFDVNTMWSIEGHNVLTAGSKDSTLDYTLPASTEDASWRTYTYGSDVVGTSANHTVKAKQRTLNLGTMDFKATFIALNAGLPAEAWTVSEARGLPIDAAQISDLKGKWVLVEFWGFW